jgi:hypothetical protein
MTMMLSRMLERCEFLLDFSLVVNSCWILALLSIQLDFSLIVNSIPVKCLKSKSAITSTLRQMHASHTHSALTLQLFLFLASHSLLSLHLRSSSHTAHHPHFLSPSSMQMYVNNNKFSLLSKIKIDADSSSFSPQLFAADFAAYRHG